MRRLRTNALLSIVGFAIPTVTLFIAYPIILRGLGEEAFGIYTLCATMSGMLSFLDLGLAGATVRFVAKHVGIGDLESASDTAAASLWFYAAVGSVLALGIALLAPLLIVVFRVPETMRDSATVAFRFAAMQFAVTFLLNVLISLVKGLQDFRLSAAIGSLLAMATYGGGALAAHLWPRDVSAVVGMTLAGALVTLLAAAAATQRRLRGAGIELARRPKAAAYRALFGYGSLTSANSIAATLINQAPRYFIGALLGPRAVSSYSIAYAAASRIHTLVATATEVLFPFASGEQDAARLRTVFRRTMIGGAILALAAMAPLVIFPELIVRIWLGTSAPQETPTLLRIFAMAFFFLTFSAGPYHLANGIGRPSWNSGFILIHMTMFVAASALGLQWGVIGLAWAYLVTNMVGVVAFLVFVERRAWHVVSGARAHALPEGRSAAP
jgi:O-antigen/teichoic acid export membrane protein